ncbi:dihydrolipoyl dehydrogenase family protein [Salinarimonas soli]|uniref:Dihydrolipoamide dehydrogenase n=1 Tax=Salinarimonas soli TaxID=1638099 RepID=A0A5B2VJB6_9HYPH|nr:FAD-dependent oxidoreductase [Salinarimonas soli]KAA2238307.1 dihydrolipoamide dehydrogenase [Salinarimonas soli]
MADLLKPDLCVIGAGSGGLSVAAIAAAFGVPVVLVERDRMGGDCLNAGCVPSKALLAAGHRAQAIREAAAFGIDVPEPVVDFARVRAHVRGVIASIAPNDSAERFTAMGVKVIKAEARFVDARTVEAGDIRIQARRFVLATGSRPAVPPIPGLDTVPYLTNETVFDLDVRPRRLIIVGGGPIGAELGQAMRRLGAEVVILEAGRLLQRDDPEMAAVVGRALVSEGVELRTGVAIQRIGGKAGAIEVTLAGGPGEAPETVEGSHLLLATGRSPTVEGLGLEEAGIAVERGAIRVDGGLRTSNRRVYAVGDCAGGGTEGLRFTHAANYHAGIVVRRALFRLPASVDNRVMPRVTYTDPELAAVGLTEEEARARHGSVRILRWPVAENDRAQAERRTQGHVKVLVGRGGRILGCSIAAAGAGDLIVPWMLAMRRNGTVSDIANLVFPYPTLSEISKRAAVEDLKPASRSGLLRGLAGALRWLG